MGLSRSQLVSRSLEFHDLIALALVVLALVGSTGCSGAKEEPPSGASTAPGGEAAPAGDAASATPAASEEPLPEVGSPYDALPESVQAVLDEPFSGDLDEMVKRRVIRAGVTFSRTHYFLDQGRQRGIAYEALTKFEEDLNKRLKTGNLKVHVMFVPLPRNMLLPALTEGKVDLVAAMLTITPERQKLVDFTNPTRTGVSEIVVTGPGAPPIASAADLSGKEVFVRKTSSYHESLQALNARLEKEGKPPVVIEHAPEVFEDDDVLEMVSAGLVTATVVDDFLAQFWSKVLPNLTLHEDIALRTGGALAVAVRKDNPKLKAALNDWIKTFGESSAFANVLEQRYLESTKFVKNAASDSERRKLEEMVALFRKYGEQYQLDALLMAAQAYQESQLNQHARSAVGAVGVMQVMPKTGKELNVGDISKVEPNIHAGIKYIRFMMDQYFKDEPMTPLDKALMTFASYNAGPGRIRQLRNIAEKRGLDRNVWFGNVERVASEKIGRETVTYVSNIYKYYVAYKLVVEQRAAKASARKSTGN